MLAQKLPAPRISNLNQANFDASHSQSQADTSHFMLLKMDKTQRTPNASKIFPGFPRLFYWFLTPFIADSAPNTARTLADVKKNDGKDGEQKHALTKRRNSKDGNIIYDYHGPTNSHIKQILEDLQARTSGHFFKFCVIKRLKKFSEDFDEFLKKRLPLWMVESKGPLAINSDSIILILLMLGTSTYFAVRIQNTEVNSDSQYLEALNTVHDTGAIFSFVFTLYGLLFLSLSFRWVLTILVIQSGILVFISLADAGLIYTKDDNDKADTMSTRGLTIRTIILICGLFWALAYPVYKVLRRYSGRFASHLYVSLVCIVIAGATIGLMTLNYMTKDESIEDMLQNNEASILVFCGIIVSSSWIVIHFKYFWVPDDSLEVALKHIARKEAKKYTNKSIEKPAMASNLEPRTLENDSGLIKRLNDNIYWISSLIIGSCYMSIEMFLAAHMLEALKTDNTRSLVTAVFFFITIPLFLIIGIPIGLSKGNLKTKSLILPLVIMIPMFGVVPLSNMLGQWSDTVDLAWYLIMGPPAACVFWLAMAFFELKRRRTFYLVTMLSCLFFFLPFVLIGLAQSELFSDEKYGFLTASKYLIIFGVVVFGIVTALTISKFMYRFIRKKVHEWSEHKKAERIEHEKRRSQLIMLEKELMEQKDEIIEAEPGGFEDCMNIALSKEGNNKYDMENGLRTGRSDDETVRYRGEGKDAKRPSEASNPGDMTSRSRANRFDKKAGKTKRALWVNLIYVNLKGFGYWINAAAFIVSYTFVVYSLYNIATNANANERGTLIGVAITMPGIFLINNLLIRMKATKFTPQERQLYLSKKELETKLFQADLQNDSRILKKSTILEIIVLVTGILLLPALQIPLLFVLEDRQQRITNVIVMICSFLVSVFVGGLIELKKRSGPYHKFFVPAFIGLCWLFVVLPFFVAIPLITIVFATDDSTFELLVKGSLTGSAFLLMIGVTALAIVINVFFQKLEEEKLIKFVVRYLQKTLKENAVLAGDDVVRRLVEHYLRKVNTSGLTMLKSELIEENFPVVPIYPPQFLPNGHYAAKLLLYETHNRFLKAMAGGFLKAQGLDKKKTLFERLAKCCADDHDEYDFDFELNLDFMQDGKDGGFRVDDYLPEGIAQPQIKWNAILQEGATPKHSDLSFNGEQQIEQEVPKPKLSQHDTDYKDAMTAKLTAIVLRGLQKEEAKVFNRGADAIRLQRDLLEMEMWYQHLFDYISGRLKVIDENEKSPGIIYKNFAQLIRIGCINLTQDQTEEIFLRTAKVKQQNISYLAYPDFINAMFEAANSLFPQKFGAKLLKAITKQIFPHMMRIPDMARNYSMVATGFTKISTPYEPCLDIFEKTIPARLPSQNDGIVKKDTIQDGPNTGDGSFEIPSGNNMNLILSGSSWTANRHRRSQIRKNSWNQVRRNTASIMPEAEDEISMTSDLQPRTPKTPASRDENAKNLFGTMNMGVGPAGLSRFGNAVAAEEKDSNQKFERRRKRKSTFKKVGRNMLFCTAACCEKLGKIYDKVVSKVVFVLTKMSDCVYNSTKGIGRALGFAIEEEHVHTEADDFDVEKFKKEAPAWPKLVDKLLKDIPIAEDLYFLKYYKNGLALMFNLANVIAILNRLEDFYSYSIAAFPPEVPWFSDTKVLQTFQSISWELSFISFKTLFWTAICLVLITLILSIPSIHYLRAGRLGEDKHGNKAKFPDPQFFLIITMSTLAGSSFCQIMKCMLDAFVCNFDTVPWTLQKDSSIECLSDEHLIYMGIGAVAIFFYYPISTFMYPNFQFQDKVLDLKYEPSFLVLSIQAKLLLTGFISFFKSTSSTGDTSSVVTKLIGIMILLFLLALITLHLRPCLIKGMNLWEAAGYLAAAWMNGAGLVVYITKNALYGAIMILAGVTVIFGTTLCVVKELWKRKPGAQKKKRKDRKVAPDQAAEETFVRFDSLKRQAVVPEEVKKMQDMKLKKIAVEGKKDEVRLKIIDNPAKARASMNQGSESPAYVF